MGSASGSGAQTGDSSQQAPAVAAPEKSYVLQRGDEISIKVFGRPELSEDFRILPDGMISVILLDDVAAAGRTTAELDSALTELYAEFYKDPQVTVIVRSFANLKVWVGGEVARPGPIELQGKLTALWAVIQAGGFRETASTDSVMLIRKGEDDRPLVSKLNLKEAMNHGGPDEILQPFDVVYVPMSGIAKVDKFVDVYMRKLIPIGLNYGFNYILNERLIAVPVP
jgi:protein involved in polysaccharide export with SLBB domain